MFSREALEAMTVIELRKLAREHSVPLSAGISKQGIVDRLAEALSAQTPAASAPRTVSIVSDDEDTPVLTPNVPFSRTPAQAQRPSASSAPSVSSAPAQPSVNRGNVPGTNKPVFSLEGVRAWHNPRTYSAPGASPFTQHAGPGFIQQRPPQPPYGSQRPASRPAAPVSRFGPDAAPSAEAPSGEPAAPEAPYRERVDARAPFGAPAYRQLPETHPTDAPYPNEGRARRESASALPELLAAADVSDGAGVLEIQPDGFGYLRTGNYLPGFSDIYVSYAQIRRFQLRTGDYISGKVRARRENETHRMLLFILEINGIDAQDVKARASFDALTAIRPARQILFSRHGGGLWQLRAIDLLCPIGFGQRALITASPRCGKTALLTAMENAIHAHYADAHLLTLLLGERPEDITVAKDTLPGEIIHAGFDEPAENQLRTAELTIERAMRLAEQKRDVVLFIDNLTSLGRAYNECAPQSARTLAGGLAAGSLSRAKRLFGAARALREGGSLTIVAIMLADTGIALDQAIAEEFRGTANMELFLNGEGVIDLARSRTRNADNMLSKDQLNLSQTLRQHLERYEPQNRVARLQALFSQATRNSALLSLLTDGEASSDSTHTA